jgi:hypothetical protein
MKLIKILFSVLLLFTLTIVSNSCRQECKTITKYMDPIDVTFTSGKSIYTYSGYQLKLKSINFYNIAPIDTLISMDSVVKADNCTFEVMKADSTNKVTFNVSIGTVYEYGQHDMSANGGINPIKIICNEINLLDSTVKIVIWNSTYLQDCGEWQ